MNTYNQLHYSAGVSRDELQITALSFRSTIAARVGAILLTVLMIGILVAAVCAPASGSSEYEVKAAFIYNFAKFVDWPDEVFGNALSPIIIGVLGSDSMCDILEQTVANKTANGRKLSVKRVSRIQDLSNCNIVFISRSWSRSTNEILESTKGSSILTIGETEGFAKHGGIINFVMNDRKVGFEINVDIAKRESIKISSKLLSLAKIVKDNK